MNRVILLFQNNMFFATKRYNAFNCYSSDSGKKQLIVMVDDSVNVANNMRTIKKQYVIYEREFDFPISNWKM